MKKIVSIVMALLGMGVTASAQDVKAVYPGGEEAMQEYITKTLQYPAEAKENGIEGVVGVTFVVKADGSIGNIKIKRMVDPDLESEAIRIVKSMPKWTPAQAGGVATETTVEVSIPFTLETE